MASPIDSEQLIAWVQSVPKGRITTYRLLAQAMGLPPHDGEEVARALQPLCRETVVVLARGGGPDDRLVPCWRIVQEWPDGTLSPLAGPTDHLEPGDPFFGILIQPLRDEGIPLSDPDYRVDRRYLFDPRDRASV